MIFFAAESVALGGMLFALFEYNIERSPGPFIAGIVGSGILASHFYGAARYNLDLSNLPVRPRVQDCPLSDISPDQGVLQTNDTNYFQTVPFIPFPTPEADLHLFQPPCSNV